MSDTPQFPNLLASYAIRPPFQVAGVDYYVGAPSGPLLDPALISMPGVSVDTSSRTVFITGDNISLSGYDFSLHNGYQAVITGNNDTITNSNFVLGTNTGGYLISISGSNATISHNTMSAPTAGNETSLIGFSGSGSITLDSNYFHDFPQHILENTQGAGSAAFSVVYTNNLIYNGHPQPGPDHLNYLQFGSGHATSVDVEHNTAYQTSFSGGEMWQFYDNNSGGVIDQSTLAYNTAIAEYPPGTTGTFEQGSQMGYLMHGGVGSNGSNIGTAHDNYFDPTTSWGPFYPGSFQGWTVTNNFDMVTGKVVAVDNSESGGSPPPAAPSIVSFSPDTNGVDTTSTVTLSGTAVPSSTVTVFDGTTNAGTTSADVNGNWSFTENNVANGTHNFTATDTNANGTSAPSSAFPVTVNGPAPPPNLVANGSFETNGLSNWTLGGNFQNSGGPEIYTTSNPESGQVAAGMGSVGSDGTLSQSIATTPGQQYTLSFWLKNEGGGPNDFTATWNGQTLLSLTNSAAFGYTQHTYTVTATGSTTTLQFSARQDPSQFDLDNISVVSTGTSNPDPESGSEKPTLTAGASALTLPAHGSVALPITVAAQDADDNVTVKISGLKSYESITDNLDHQIFKGTSIRLTLAEVNSGLTLMSSYGGTNHPQNTLSITATNSTAGESGTSATKSIVVTDPPAATTSPVDASHNAMALLVQSIAAFPGAGSTGPLVSPMQAHAIEPAPLLARPHA